jgi:hypothetical protein
LHKNKKYTSEYLCVKTRFHMRISGGLLFMWDVSPGFQNAISVATS